MLIKCQVFLQVKPLCFFYFCHE
jgi:hypothetical protein